MGHEKMDHVHTRIYCLLGYHDSADQTTKNMEKSDAKKNGYNLCNLNETSRKLTKHQGCSY
jgi:hypothetical protein